MKKRESSARSDLSKRLPQGDSEGINDERRDIHPDVLAISGLVPAEVDAEAEYRAHLLRKHR